MSVPAGLRAAIYKRVSTTREEDEGSGLDTQDDSCQSFIRARGWELVATYSDTLSGRREKRPGFDQMLHDAAMKQFRAVVVFKLDRLTRSGIRAMFTVIDKLGAYGVRVYSVTDSWFDPANPAYEMILSALAFAADLESRAISERVKAAIARKRKDEGDGFVWGQGHFSLLRQRPTLTREARELRETGLSWAEVGRRLGVSPSTAKRAATMGLLALTDGERED